MATNNLVYTGSAKMSLAYMLWIAFCIYVGYKISDAFIDCSKKEKKHRGWCRLAKFMVAVIAAAAFFQITGGDFITLYFLDQSLAVKERSPWGGSKNRRLFTRTSVKSK